MANDFLAGVVAFLHPPGDYLPWWAISLRLNFMDREIINTYDQLKAAGGGIAICYCAQDTGRGGHPAYFSILKINRRGKEVQTNPRAPWYDHGRQTLTVGHPIAEKKPMVLEAAKAWVSMTYNDIGPWVRNRMGDYVHALVNQQFPIRRNRK